MHKKLLTAVDCIGPSAAAASVTAVNDDISDEHREVDCMTLAASRAAARKQTKTDKKRARMHQVHLSDPSAEQKSTNDEILKKVTFVKNEVHLAHIFSAIIGLNEI